MLDRQERIHNWNQTRVKEQVCLCLGVGGVGGGVCLQLLRLGVGKLILVDYDKVEESNLNRQILYSQEDIGLSKIESSFKSLSQHNIDQTEILTYDLDILKNVNLLKQLVQSSTVVFNMIDYGDSFDYLIQSICLQYSKTLL